MAGYQKLSNRHSTSYWLFRILGVAAILLAGYLIFELGRIRADFNVIDAAAERRLYEDRITGLESEVRALQEKIVLLETDAAIDREGYKEVEARLARLRNKIQEQLETIEFYRGIVAPADGQRGLRVQDLRIKRGSADGLFNTRLVLIQTMQHDRTVKGRIDLTIDGTRAGSPLTLELAALSPAGAAVNWSYSFRYFQNFDRELQLPDGFVPERINIELHSQSKSVTDVKQSFPWLVDK